MALGFELIASQVASLALAAGAGAVVTAFSAVPVLTDDSVRWHTSQRCRRDQPEGS